MKSTHVFYLLFLYHSILLGQQEATTLEGHNVILYENGSWSYPDRQPLQLTPQQTTGLHIQKSSDVNHTIISHTGFSLVYNKEHKQSEWVFYELTNEKTKKITERTDIFLPDPKIITGTATNKDYQKSGYDRGHLAPAADMAWSETAIKESFYYSNISPQLPEFNRGIWKKLEKLVRIWAVENETIYIVTGPVLSNNLPSIGVNNVSIPNYFYKVILDYQTPDIKGIGFILPHEASNLPLQHFAVSIDSIEALTGLDFFSELPDHHEELIEKTLCRPCWTWDDKKPVSTQEQKGIISNQCKGITKSGKRCKNRASDKDEFCHIHK